MAELTQRQKYDLKRQIEELKTCKGKHTELISLYVPPTKQISDVVAYLKNEFSQSQNIKSKTTRKNVLSAIESIMSRLRQFRNPPENGVIFFVGHKSVGSDQTDMVAYVVEPPMPITTFLYRCDSLFYTELLDQMLTEKEIYGLFLLDRRECTIGMLRGDRVDLLKYMTSQVPGKHGRGGQSQRRFERLTEIAAHEWFVRCGEKASEIFLTEGNMKGIFVGGSGPTKQYFVAEGFLHHEIQNKVLEVFDTGYTDEFGLKELVAAAAETMTDLKISKEKKVMKRFLSEVTKTEKSLAAYGEQQIRRALQMGVVDTLVLSEELRQYRITIRCPSCDYREQRTISEEILPDFEPSKCPTCDTSVSMEVEKKIDVIDELSELAEQTGASVELISRNSEEGDSLYRAFDGIAAILRYPVDLF
ncbi:MAG: peptide chain release factor aRF-1 [Candidatus Thermoplasmatota archaeon]|nr:peptide chain release factor aRF-1 [Candidatus Thermoplasmatota archaeon]MBU1940863.1 peptide chain release factor aRF-1 [Candidatus Thermoplasmatota archaeon]